ncbi:hypothetical protein ACIBSV_43845 [Embleya sp. NPDC050154]|uniref:hypothetical protein n=1 Tax=unclassified Embleya TaxID=2699296 RepID=UPI0037A89C14
MKLRTKLLSVLGTTAVLAGGGTVLASPASAECTTCEPVVNATVYTNGTRAGEVRFKSYGEHLYVRDFKQDGMAVVAEYYVGNADPLYRARNTVGVGYTLDVDLEIPERWMVQFRACVYKANTRVTCGGWITDYA